MAEKENWMLSGWYSWGSLLPKLHCCLMAFLFESLGRELWRKGPSLQQVCLYFNFLKLLLYRLTDVFFETGQWLHTGRFEFNHMSALRLPVPTKWVFRKVRSCYHHCAIQLETRAFGSQFPVGSHILPRAWSIPPLPGWDADLTESLQGGLALATELIRLFLEDSSVK